MRRSLAILLVLLSVGVAHAVINLSDFSGSAGGASVLRDGTLAMTGDLTMGGNDIVTGVGLVDGVDVSALVSAGGLVSTHSDVTISGVAANQVLVYNGSVWANIANSVSSLSDTTITAPSANEYLQWNGSAWINADGDNFGDHAATQAAVFFAGTIGAPGIVFAGDTDTGFWHQTGGEVSFSADGAELLSFTSSGIELFNAKSIAFYEAVGGGTNSVSISSTVLAADYSLLLPPDDGDVGEVLQTNGSGTLTFEKDGISPLAGGVRMGSFTPAVESVYLVSAAAGAFTITLPDATGTGHMIEFYEFGGTTNVLTFGRFTSNTINGSASDLLVSAPYGHYQAVDVAVDSWVVSQVSNGAAAYGNITAESNVTATVIGTASSDFSNKVQVLTFGANGTSLSVTPDHANDHITILVSGHYIVEATISLSGAASTTYSLGLHKNNGATLLGVRTTQRLDASGNVTSCTVRASVALAATDTIELWAQNETNTSDLTLEDGTLTVTKVD